MEKLIGWQGLSFFANSFQIHRSSGPRDEHFTSLITISNIEAFSSTRLSELWFEQKFFDDRFSIRFGQLTTDSNFFISDYSKMFISSDWPTIMGSQHSERRAGIPARHPRHPMEVRRQPALVDVARAVQWRPRRSGNGQPHRHQFPGQRPRRF